MEALNIALADSILGGAFVLVFTCIYIVYAKVDKNQTSLLKRMDDGFDDTVDQFKKMSSQLEASLKKLDREVEITDDRIDMFDRLISTVADSKFNSKLVVQGRRSEPSLDNLKSVIIRKAKVPNGEV